ncbi:HORMA domain-containing protein 1 [Trichonephila clavata]|uniref:HORMA domain-containing protein 1 n=1 Tax=Trichonephila clavata TaxID=2740835 RepID=A0A8X6KRE3_TRICU|nr:HORMA domain-containing protein 1 [Trichonephila clavata]
MAVAMMTSQDETLQEWKTIFPEFATLEGSCLFIKKLIAVSLSSITYIRGIFPDEAYGERNLGGLRLKLLTEDCGINSVSKFIDSIRSCYDAVEKRYLQQLGIGICVNKKNHNEVIEAYNLVFSYKEDECSITCRNKTKTFSPKLSDPTVKASFLMLKNISTLSNILGNLPKNVYLSLKLLYFDDVTPEDYEPPGFEPSTLPKFSFPEKTINISLGKIETEKHGYGFLLKTTVNKHPLSQRNSEDPLLSASQTSINAKKLVSSQKSPDNQQLPQTFNSGITEDSLENVKIIAALKCPCKCKSAQDYDIVVCTNCQQIQHRTCYGILKSDHVPGNFYCVNCIPHDDEYFLSDAIYSCQRKDRQVFCIIRRALSFCLELLSVTKSNLAKFLGCSKSMINTIFKRLETEDFIKLQANTDEYQIQKSNITHYGLPEYFPSKQIKNYDELMEEDSKFENSISLFNTDNERITSMCIDETASIENSIKKVKSLKLHDMSPDKMNTRSSQKRKASSEIVNLDDSGVLFQSQKRSRVNKLRKHRISNETILKRICDEN